MKPKVLATAFVAMILLPCSLIAQAPAGAPAGATGKCKDGTFTTTPTKQGACRGHKGVDTWFASATSAPKASATTAAPASTSKSASAATAANGPAPSGATGKCKDGSYTTAPKKQGACRGHQGVDTWYAAESTPSQAASKTSAATTTAATPAAAPVSTPAPAAASTATPKASTRTSAASKTPAPGGGPGLVWVNSSTNVYHCYGTQFYGTTKAGKYMSEADAKAAGARPDRNKACSAK
jgi:hypothetical protein